jgi:hypothetical protein
MPVKCVDFPFGGYLWHIQTNDTTITKLEYNSHE